MPISIKNDETEHLAREVAKLTGGTLTGAIHDALTEKYDRIKRTKSARIVKEELTELALRCSRRPDVSTLTDDEVLGYDEYGVPTR